MVEKIVTSSGTVDPVGDGGKVIRKRELRFSRELAVEFVSSPSRLQTEMKLNFKLVMQLISAVQ